MTIDINIDILSRLDAMRVQEETTRCINNFKGNGASRGDDVIDEACRGAMATWIQQVQRTLSLSPETVWIAMSFFDRYLGSGRRRSGEVLRSKREFQLAAITAFYTAVKIHEPVVLGIDMLLTICRGTYTESDVTSMEREILSALEWRVATHTPMDFASHLLRLLPEERFPSDISDSLLADCRRQLDHVVGDMHFTCARPSDVGIGCLASSLAGSDALSPSEKREVWTRLSEACHFALSSEETIATRRRFLSDASPSAQRSVSKLSQQSSAAISAYSVGGESSPICVTQTARLA